MVSKFLSGAAASLTLAAANMAPVFANPTTNIKTSNGITVSSVAPKSNLVVIEGRTLTDAESAKVEGQIVWKAAAAKFIVKQSFKFVVTASANQISSFRRGGGIW